MAAHLHYTRANYAANASQTTTVTLAGETSNAPLTEDMTIHVPCTDLGLFLTWTGAYTSQLKDGTLLKSYPTVKLDTPAMAAQAAVIDEKFRHKDYDSLDEPNAHVETLQGIFKNATWVYGTKVFEDADLPIEAVVQVENGAITATTLAMVVVAFDEDNTQGSHPVDLFEQCLATGKIPAGQLNDVNGTGRPTFETDDSISLYVRYTITKTRKFQVDSDVQNTGVASITVGGVTISSGAAREELADSQVRVVRWKFTQTSS